MLVLMQHLEGLLLYIRIALPDRYPDTYIMLQDDCLSFTTINSAEWICIGQPFPNTEGYPGTGQTPGGSTSRVVQMLQASYNSHR